MRVYCFLKLRPYRLEGLNGGGEGGGGGSACRLSFKISLLCWLSVKLFGPLSVNPSSFCVASRQFLARSVGSQLYFQALCR